jgi:hypothetical protein
MRKLAWIFLLLAAGPSGALAKRLPPPMVLPVDDGTYRFVVRENGKDNRRNIYRGGHVEAYLKKSGRKIWDKFLYAVQVDPNRERDIQDIFICKVYLERPDRLVVENEDAVRFILNRRTGDLLERVDYHRDFSDRSMYYVNTDKVEPIMKGDYLIEADERVGYGHQKVRSYDLPTGRLLWESRLSVPKIKKAEKGKGNRISILWINKEGELEITFFDNSGCVLDLKTGEVLKVHKAP